jgi:cell wall-associated NlpC family hydrolase
MTGPDVEEAQKLLGKNPFGNFLAGTPDGDYGEVTADAVQRAKAALGFPDAQVNRVFGERLRSFLSGKTPLPAAFAARGKARQSAAPAEDKIRAKIVEWALWGVANKDRIAYSQGTSRLAALDKPGTLPLATDCSAFSTLCYAWAKAPNPNWPGPYKAEMGGYTGTMLNHCKHVPQSAAKPGDLVVWTPPATGQHVAMVAATGPDPWLVSHGSDSGPSKIRFSDEDAYQRQHGHGTAVFLSAF